MYGAIEAAKDDLLDGFRSTEVQLHKPYNS